MGIYFTADTHFDHNNIIKYCNRPFSTVDDMNMAMVHAWNSKIGADDFVYHLGDVTLGDVYSFAVWMYQLNGNIRIIPGSHDRGWIGKFKDTDRIKIIDPLVSISFPGIAGTDKLSVTMCHYSMRVWNKSHYGSYHLFGHSHGNLHGIGRSMDVGVDTNNFYPYSLVDIHNLLKDIPIHNPVETKEK
jgi:calcineurin-like phosphoesterase family protein